MKGVLSIRRLRALITKEFLQISRDPSSILIAFLLPGLLLLIFGYGISLDTRKLAIGVVASDPVADVREFIAGLQNSGHFEVEVRPQIEPLETRLMEGSIRAIVVIPEDFQNAARKATGAPGIQVIADGSEPQLAAVVQQYVTGVLMTVSEQKRTRMGADWQKSNLLEVRFQFNPSVQSRNVLIPGSLAVIMTIVGALLTALVIAREWERGTMEALLASPVTRLELILGKIIPYFILGYGSFLFCFTFATVGLGVPFRGSFLALSFVTSIFLLTVLGIGLVISAKTKDQFVASQVALNVAFLPALILSGFIFEIPSMPLPIQILTRIIPARYFVNSLQTLFLAGDIWPILLPNIGFLICTTFLFIGMTSKNIKRRID